MFQHLTDQFVLCIQNTCKLRGPQVLI
uniref:Uncharacterized protein n=1 Tax=Rhizophora mucronata TaxID=61149 RepID=A0A2P2PTK3_RHIMU